jgi:proteasome lid subunit RPN8/RPN11
VNLPAGQRRAIGDMHVIARHGGPTVVYVGEPDALGRIPIDLNFDCRGVQVADDGLPLRRSERLRVFVPRGFPHELPIVQTPHRRWAKQSHVQWGHQICLYRSPSVEWDPTDGMFGFVDRVIQWLALAAAGKLDPAGQPLHPPVAYQWFGGGGVLVVRADAPRAQGGKPWLGIALLRTATPPRFDIIGWSKLGSGWLGPVDAAHTAEHPVFCAAVVLLPEPIGFEMPYYARTLARHLARQGSPQRLTLGLIGLAASYNDMFARQRGATAPYPLYVLVGTPSRGTAGQQLTTHVAAWRVPDDTAPLLAAVPDNLQADGESTASDVGESVLTSAKQWLDVTEVRWATVYEMRPETTIRRDEESPTRWLRHRRILVLGAGALGGPVAEACVRGGAASVTVSDEADVHPGILVRQAYDDADIGTSKAVTLSQRLNRIWPDTPVTAIHGDAVKTLLAEAAEPPEFDLIIDATADRIVRHVIETRRRSSDSRWPPIISMMVGHKAQRGIATVSCDDMAGGPVDILRRLGMAARTDTTRQLSDVAEDFFADPPRADLFEPEPGCSSPTFRGSAAEIGGLVGQLLTGALDRLDRWGDGRTTDPMHAIVVRTPTANVLDRPGIDLLSWPADMRFAEATGEYQLRLAPTAVAEIRAESRRGARVRKPDVETGGLLLGQFDDAAGIIWVDAATGPPPDSRLSSLHFEHGTQGATEIAAAQMQRTSRTSGFVGMWHSHPNGTARPSETDEIGMAHLVSPVDDRPRRAVLLIVGGAGTWSHWLAGRGEPSWYARVVDRSQDSPQTPSAASSAAVLDTAKWWPGGYAIPRDRGTELGPQRDMGLRLRMRRLLRRFR